MGIRKLMGKIFTERELHALDDPLPSWGEVFSPLETENDKSSSASCCGRRHREKLLVEPVAV